MKLELSIEEEDEELPTVVIAEDIERKGIKRLCGRTLYAHRFQTKSRLSFPKSTLFRRPIFELLTWWRPLLATWTGARLQCKT